MSEEKKQAINLTTKIVQGGAWVFGRMLFTNVINIVVMAILARQLTPAEFGLAAVANIILRLFNILTSQGSNQYVIYDNKEGREERAGAAFWLDFALALCCTFIGILLIPAVVNFYKLPELKYILLVLFLKYPIDAISKVPDAMIRKDLEFKKLEIRDTILEVLSGILSVIFVFTGFGVWSLIVPGMITSPIRALIVFSISKWKPGFNFHFNFWPKIFKFSSNVIGGTLTSFVLAEGDSMIIGRILGAHALGIYNLSWQSANIVGRTIVTLSNKLTFPALSKVAADPEKLKESIGRVLKLLSITTFPLLIGLFVVADDFILTIYGSQWKDSILPLRILIVFALRYTAGSPMGMVFIVLGRPDINFKAGLAIVPVYLASIIFGCKFGVIGVAIAVTVVRSLNGIIYFYIASRLLKESFWKLVSPMNASLTASLIMGVSLVLLKLLLGFEAGGVSLALFTVVGGMIYWLLLRGPYNQLSQELVNLSDTLLGHKNRLARRILNVA